MIQNLSAFSPELWTPSMQGKFYKENVAIALANTELRDELPVGTKIHKPYRGSMKDQAYSKGVPITITNALTATDDYGEVDTTRLVDFFVDDLDKMENKYPVAALHAQDAQKMLNDRIDQAVISKGVTGAHSFISAQDLGGSGTGAATLNTANVANLFAVAGRKLTHRNIPESNRFALIGPRLLETLRVSVAGRETGFGDTVGDNGIVAKRFGFGLYLSNNIPFEAKLTEGGQPSAAEYIDIDGVRLTFRANGEAAAAGDVSIGANAAATYASVVHAINGTGTAGASNYVEVSADNREILRSRAVVAAYGTNVLTLTGYGDVSVQEYATNVVLTSNIQKPLFGIKGAIDLLLRKAPYVEFRTPEYLLGKRVYVWTNYGTHVFNQNKKALVYSKIDASSWV